MLKGPGQSAEAYSVKPLDEFALPLVSDAESCEVASEFRRLSAFPGTLAQIEQ